jgi:hypothetical protein
MQLDYLSNRRIKTKLRMAPAQFREMWLTVQQLFSTPTHRNPQAMKLTPLAPSRLYESEEQPLLLIE